jgi:hypothetical protein
MGRALSQNLVSDLADMKFRTHIAQGHRAARQLWTDFGHPPQVAAAIADQRCLIIGGHGVPSDPSFGDRVNRTRVVP